MGTRLRLKQLIQRPFSVIVRQTILSILVLCVILLMIVSRNSVAAQQTCERILIQDSTINNLVDPAGYETAQLGTLGGVFKVGTGSRNMVLIPSLGFGGDIFAEFMETRKTDFTMYAITLAGFGGSPAPPSPAEDLSYSNLVWTNGALAGLEELFENEGLENVIMVGHFLGGTQLAIRFAMANTEKIQAVVLIAGTACFISPDTIKYHPHLSLASHVASVDYYFAPKWFRTVTQETWDDNNFMPRDYAMNPVRGLRLWRGAARTPLHVRIRYYCEFLAQDISQELENLTVPTLLLRPGLEGLDFDPSLNYLERYCHTSWEASVYKYKNIEVETVPQTRLCMWFDEPEEVFSRISDFLERQNRK